MYVNVCVCECKSEFDFKIHPPCFFLSCLLFLSCLEMGSLSGTWDRQLVGQRVSRILLLLPSQNGRCLCECVLMMKFRYTYSHSKHFTT